MARHRLVILISGSGSNLQAFIDATKSGTLDAEIACVISNKAGVFGLTRAEKNGIPTQVLSHTDFASREDYDAALLASVQQHAPDLVILAGFMRILTPVFVTPLYGKLMNIHPSLLPKYPGLHTHQRALDARDNEAGVTVHFVSAELDAGPIIVQARVPILPGDNATALAARVLEQEHRIYPLAARWYCEGLLRCDASHAWFNNEILPASGKILS
jgi:phosphoribosylglycinamide formyltransferase-1